MKKLVLTLVALAAISSLAAMAATSALANNAPPKVIVCKFVGTPGVNETLQTGQNPIAVSQNALDGKGFAGVFPFTFQDAQGQSVAIRYATGPTDNGNSDDLAFCQTLIPPQPPVLVTPVAPTVSAATCDTAGVLTLPANTSDVTYTSVDNGDGTSTVTATPADGVTLVAGNGYTLQDDGTATIVVAVPGATGNCPTTPPPPVTKTPPPVSGPSTAPQVAFTL